MVGGASTPIDCDKQDMVTGANSVITSLDVSWCKQKQVLQAVFITNQQTCITMCTALLNGVLLSSSPPHGLLA
jgi:hypothetical protein